MRSPSPGKPGEEQQEWLPPARWPENAKERAKLTALRERMGIDQPSNQPAPEVDDARYGGWRPGAHWAKDSDEWLDRKIASKRARKAAALAEIEGLPLHQRPPMRELGRRSEPAPHPFRPMPRDEAAQPAGRVSPYNLEGAFWQQGRTLGTFVAREVIKSSPSRSDGEGDHAKHGGGVNGAALVHRTSCGPPPQALLGEEAPLITTHRVGSRVLVAAACPRAQALGLHSGMPLTQARALVPGLDIRPADPDGEAADLERLALHAARHWTPLVTALPGEGLWLDIGASAHLFGGERSFAHRLLRLCHRLGLTARIAIADTAGAAHALAKIAAGPVILCPPESQAEALAALPLTALRIDKADADQARRLGIDTIGALAAIPRAPLVRRFGPELVRRLDEALGARAEPIDQLVPVQPPAVGRRFAEPLLTAEPIGAALSGLVRELTESLAAGHLGARTVALALTRVDASDQRIEIGLARPSRDPDHIGRLLGSRIEEIEPGFGIEAMRLVAARVDPLAPQPVRSPLSHQDAAGDLACLVDRLATRLGARRLCRLGPVESDVPERSVRRLGPLETSDATWEPWPRPVRLLDPPERVEGVMALLPDGVPKRFTWRGRAYNVVRGDGPERIHGEWWRRACERESIRDYFRVEDFSGTRFWLFRRGDAVDDRTGDLSWHLHGLFA